LAAAEVFQIEECAEHGVSLAIYCRYILTRHYDISGDISAQGPALSSRVWMGHVLCHSPGP
jgi:hypothetical protein